LIPVETNDEAAAATVTNYSFTTDSDGSGAKARASASTDPQSRASWKLLRVKTNFCFVQLNFWQGGSLILRADLMYSSGACSGGILVKKKPSEKRLTNQPKTSTNRGDALYLSAKKCPTGAKTTLPRNSNQQSNLH